MPDIFIQNNKKEQPEDTVRRGHEEGQPQQPQPQSQSAPSQPQQQHNSQAPSQQKPPQSVSAKLSTSLPSPGEGKAPNLFSAYCAYPKGITFMNQEEDETLLLFLRRHFITNVPWIFFTVLFLIVPPLLFLLFSEGNFTLFSIPPQLTFVLVVFYYIVIFNYALGKFIVWFYHVGIVTPKRLLDLDVDNILHYHLAETELRDVVDVSYMQKGFFQSFFNFGNVPIQTEAIKANFEFEQTPNPAKVADIVTDLRPKH